MDDQTFSATGASLHERSVADALRSFAPLMGCPVAYLQRPRTKSITRASDDDQTVRTFVRGPVGLVSLPHAEPWSAELDQAELEELLALTRLETPVGAVVELPSAKLLVADDPAAMMMVDEYTMVERRDVPAALVRSPSASVLDMLRNAVPAHEWTEGGGDLVGVRRVGALSGGVLVALATVDRPIGRLARVRALVDPTMRRRGFGRSVLREITRVVIREGLLPYLRVSVGDLVSRAVARDVGFVSFARSLSLHILGVHDTVLGDSRPGHTR